MGELDIAQVRRQMVMLSARLQVEKMAESMKNQTTGSFFIEDISWTDIGSDKLALLNVILHDLMMRFPEFEFAQYESLRPSERGMLIEWKLKYRYIPKQEVSMPEIEAPLLQIQENKNAVR